MRNIEVSVKGKLQVVETNLSQSKDFIESKVIAKDEDGVTWNVTGRNFPFDLTPFKFPDEYPGTYLIGNRYFKYAVQANTLKDAKNKIKHAFEFRNNDNLTLSEIKKPVPEADEVMIEAEFNEFVHVLEDGVQKPKARSRS